MISRVAVFFAAALVAGSVQPAGASFMRHGGYGNGCDTGCDTGCASGCKRRVNLRSPMRHGKGRSWFRPWLPKREP